MAQAISKISRAMVNNRLVMGKTHMASSLRIKVRTKNTTRSIMTATHLQQGTVASSTVMVSNSNMASSNKAMESNSSTDSTTRAPIQARVDPQPDQMADQRQIEDFWELWEEEPRELGAATRQAMGKQNSYPGLTKS